MREFPPCNQRELQFNNVDHSGRYTNALGFRLGMAPEPPSGFDTRKVDTKLPISDHIRFSAVCKHWKSVALHHKQQRVKSPHNQLPMLMIPTKHNSSERRGLYGVTQRKPYNFELYVPYKKRCCGSSHGWLACADDNLAITLLNPFTGRTIRLPPVTEVPPQAETFSCDYYINKLVLVSK
ncbi:hypothetical protein FF2_035813 [Malus domestica]